MMQPSRKGFTLVELLVVMTIIAILVMLLLPAVQEAREAGRRSQCQNNIKNVGLAIANYESAWGWFPPSSVWPKEVTMETKNNQNLRETWVILILPQLDQQPVFDRFDLRQPIPSTVNAEARSKPLAIMMCPDDSYARTPFMGSQSSLTNQLGDNWARCNYAANGSLGYLSHDNSANDNRCGVQPPLNMNAGLSDKGWKDRRIRGVMGANVSARAQDIKDGLSNTVLLAEIRAGVTPFDTRGIWAMAGACPNSLWAHGYCGDDWGPNNNQSLMADDVLSCTEVQKYHGGEAALANMGMSCSRDNSPNSQQTARSLHQGGVFTCFCDGSVHWISDSIDVSVNNPAKVSVWDRLMLSYDGLPVAADQY